MPADYEPIDLDPHLNASADLVPGEPPTGAQQLRGLPFLIGQGERAFVGLGHGLGEQPVTIRVGRVARNVLVAHRLLESNLLAGGPVGVAVAEYVFRYGDGTEERVPIRERFEIATPLGFGQHPFAAVPDSHDRLVPRSTGEWGQTGRRQTEVDQGVPRGYYLFSWTNPRPETSIDSIELVPCGPRMVVAGITLGHADERPFVRDGALPVRIELTDPALAARPFDVVVEVDRGVATYPYALPAATPDDFVADGLAGWGEPLNRASSPSYADVAALPSATVTVRVGGETVGAVRWRDVQVNGVAEGGRVRVTRVEAGRNWVETTVVDDETGRPVPCRVHFRSPQGVPYQPHGHHGHVFSNMNSWHVDIGGDLRLGQISYAYVDGRCAGWLPRGRVLVDVARGFEYEPLREAIEIAPGQRRLELRLRRWTNMNARRWFSGDTHVHFLSTQGSHREAQGEDLNVVNLLLSQWGHLFTNTEEFTGAPTVSPDGRTIVYATQENRQHLLGHLTLLGLKRHVYPWCSDGPSEAELGGTLETAMAHWADACHEQGGTVVLPHLPTPNGEPAALIATGRVDAVEIIRFAPYVHTEYYRYLNAGYRLPLVGGTDKMSSEVAVGQYRTYVRIPADEEFSYDNWCRNLRLGRTFLSGGPLIELSVEGAEIGDTVRLSGGGTVEAICRAESTIPVHTLQIVKNGEIVAETTEPDGARSLSIRTRIPIDRHAWICARVAGPDYTATAHHDVWQRGVFAHTSPVYVAVGGEWAMTDPAGLQYMLTLVDGSLQYVRGLAPRHQPETTTHHHGEPDHQAYLERPFLEARAAIHRRLHQLGLSH